MKKDADAEEIKKAYRKLARANHPDSNPGDAAKHDKFKAVAEAYDVVGDAEKRKKYDEMRSPLRLRWRLPRRRREAGASTSTTCSRDRAGGGGGFGDMFGDLFGGGGRRQQQARRPVKGPDAETSATISFTDAIEGVTISLRLTSDARLPRLPGHRRQARHQAAHLSRVRGRRLRRRPRSAARSR